MSVPLIIRVFQMSLKTNISPPMKEAGIELKTI